MSIFQVAIEIDDHRILVPSKLPIDAPAPSPTIDSRPLLTRYHLFPCVPYGFWARFISRFLFLTKEMLLPRLSDEVKNENETFQEYFADSADLGNLLDKKIIKCWDKGVIFDHPLLYFSVQQTSSIKENRETIETRVQRSPLGYRVLSYVIDHIKTLLCEWFAGLANSTEIDSFLACPVCTYLAIKPPFLFDVNYLFETIYQTSNEKLCSFLCDNNHAPRVVNLADYCPDLTFGDLTEDLKLRELDIDCNKSKELGFGQYGKIYLGTLKGKKVAVKCYKFSDTNGKPSLESFYDMRQEIVMLSKLRHPHIIEFLGVSLKPELRAVLEYAEHGSLSSFLHEKIPKEIPRIVRFRICQQIASALAHMHQRFILHRDIKADNILVFSIEHDAKINIKIADLGTANFMSRCGLKVLNGTLEYAAPEMILFKSSLDDYTSSIDIYSFSFVIFELITYQRPFHKAKYSWEITDKVIKGFRPMFFDSPYALYGVVNLTKLMTVMWHQEPSKRPNAKSVLNQLLSPAFQLIFGIKKLSNSYSPREICYVGSTEELWVSCENTKGNIFLSKKIFLIFLCRKKKHKI